MASTCRRWRQITQRADMWKHVCLTDNIALYGRDDVKLPFLMWLQQRCTAMTELQIQASCCAMLGLQLTVQVHQVKPTRVTRPIVCIMQFKGRTSGESKKDIVTSTVIVAIAPAAALRQLRIQMPGNGSISSSTLVSHRAK